MPPRPELPLKHQNPHLKSRASRVFILPLNPCIQRQAFAVDVNKLPPVKYQSLDRDGHQVLVLFNHSDNPS